MFVRTEAENLLDTPQGPFSVAWAYFNPSMDKKLQALLSLSEKAYPFTNFNGCEWMSDQIANFTGHVITHPRRD